MCSGCEHEQVPVYTATHTQQPGAAADVAVPNQLPFTLRVYVDVDALQTIGADELNRIFHREPS